MTETLYIDSNEPDNVQTTVELTVKDRDTGATTERKGLKTADFIYQDVAIERKKASDLANSIVDGRLKEQTLRMLEDFEHQYIIIEGNPYNLKHSNLHTNAFIGTMVSRTSEGTGIIYTPDVEGTAYAVNKIISKHKEGAGREVTELKRTNVETEDVQVAMLTCIEGVSKEKAKKVKDKIGSIEKLSQYSAAGMGAEGVEKLKEIDGIGDKIASRIVYSVQD